MTNLEHLIHDIISIQFIYIGVDCRVQHRQYSPLFCSSHFYAVLQWAILLLRKVINTRLGFGFIKLFESFLLYILK